MDEENIKPNPAEPDKQPEQPQAAEPPRRDLRPRPPALPPVLPEPTRVRTLNDLVDAVHRTLYIREDSPYRSLLEAVWDSDAVEGDCDIDDSEAAGLIRDEARVSPDPEVRARVGKANKATLVHCLKIVLNRYKLGRKYRRTLIDGLSVDENGDD